LTARQETLWHKGQNQKIYCSRALQPQFPAYAPEFLRDRGNWPDGTVAVEHVLKKVARLFRYWTSDIYISEVHEDMLQLFDFEQVPIDQRVPFERDAR
jgi:hypothetical protein